MRKLVLVIVLVLLVALLGACGLIANLVPPIEIGDPLGVEGQSVTTTFASVESAALSTQSVSRAGDTLMRSFEDVEFDLRGFSVASLDAKIGFDPVVVLSTSDALATFPDRFTLTRVSARGRVVDAVNGEAILEMERDVSFEFVLDAGACGVSACAYMYAGGEEIADALNIVVPSSESAVLDAFVQIVRLDGANSRNEGSFSVMMWADSEPSLDGFSATFTLRNYGTTIRVGG